MPVYGSWALFAFIFFIGVYVSTRFTAITGLEDPGSIVIDEIAGLMIFYLIFPFKPIYIIAGFILFRFFDKMKNGWGIMLDDIVAGLYAVLVWFIVLKILKYFNIAIG